MRAMSMLRLDMIRLTNMKFRNTYNFPPDSLIILLQVNIVLDSMFVDICQL